MGRMIGQYESPVAIAKPERGASGKVRHVARSTITSLR